MRLSITPYSTVYLSEDERIDESQDDADSAPPFLASPLPLSRRVLGVVVRLPAKLSDRLETPHRGPFS